MDETLSSFSSVNRPGRLRGSGTRFLLAVALLVGVATPALAADYVWTEGVYSATTFPTTIGADDNLYISGGPVNLNVSLTNYGHVYWVSGNVPCSGGYFVNYGVVAITADGRWGYAGAGAGSSFTNYGTVYKTAGAGSTVFYWANYFYDEFTFVNSGTIEVQSGTIQYESPITRFLAGTVFAGTGQHAVASHDARFEGPFTVNPDSHLRFDGGQLTSTTASTTFTGTVTFAGGYMHGPWAIPAGSTVAVVSGTEKRFDNAQITCSGTVTLADTLFFTGGTTVSNDGVFDFLGDYVIRYNGGNGCTFDNLAAGTIRKSGGPGAGGISWGNYFWDELLFYNWGTLDAEAGALEYNNPGTHFLDGTRFVGVGTHRVTVTHVSFAGSVTADAAVVVDPGGQGSLTGDAAVLHGTFDWRSGDLSDTWTLAGDGILDLSTGVSKRFTSGTFTNLGTVNLQATLGLSSVTLVNQGLVDIQGPYLLAYADGGWPAVTNQGVIRASGGGATGTSYELALSNEASGTIDAQAGTFTCGSHDFASNAGTIRVAGGATFAMPGALTNLGTISGGGTLQVPSLVNQGVVSPGSSVGTLTVTGAFSQGGAGTLDLQLAGTTPGSGHDQLVVGGGAALGGTLRATLAGGFHPAVGDIFTLLAATTSGEFDALDLPALAGDDWEVGYSPVTLTLREAADVLFADGFENGTASAWSHVVPSDKVRVLRFAGAPEWFELVVDLEPRTSPAVATLIAFPTADRRGAALAVDRRADGDSVELRTRRRDADGTTTASPWSIAVPATTRIELHWAAAADGAANGALYLYGDTGLLAAMAGLELGPGEVGDLRLAGVEVVDLVAPVEAALE